MNHSTALGRFPGSTRPGLWQSHNAVGWVLPWHLPQHRCIVWIAEEPDLRLRASAHLTQLRIDLQFFKLMLLTVAHFDSAFRGGGHYPSRRTRLCRVHARFARCGMAPLLWPRGFELRTSCFKSTLHRVTVRDHSAVVISMRFLVFVHCFAHVAGGLPGAMLPKERFLLYLGF